MKSLETAADVGALLRARNALLWIVTREEARVEDNLVAACEAAKFVPRFWDVAQGCTDVDGKPAGLGDKDPGATLDMILDRATSLDVRGDKCAWIMRDLPAWLSGPAGAITMRQVRNLARIMPEVPLAKAQALIILSPYGEVPPELTGHATVIEWPMPDRAEIAGILDALIEQYDLKDMLKNGARDAAIDSAVGLTGQEAKACYSRSLVSLKRIDPAVVAKEKKRVIARERVLEWNDPIPGGLDAVGGLDVLKSWLAARASAYSPAARAYGLPAPKGCLLVGVPGCGKSLTAKAIATAWGCPLLRLDLGALKSKFVGESEGNLRRAFRIIESVGRCVVWIDEVEKALQGATSGSSDGGVSSDALGAVLSWMQERTSDAFVIATANDVSSLPPELLRKGRFDELFFVDLPNAEERMSVLAASLRAHGRSMSDSGLRAAADACEGFAGAEIAAIVPDALFAAFADGARDLQVGDLLAAAKTVTPLAKTAEEKIGKLRAWAKDRARAATSQLTSATASERRGGLDL